MSYDPKTELYQQVILEHNKKPKNYRVMEDATHKAEGYNPLCGDQLNVFLKIDSDKVITDVSFEGEGCAISKASASLMTGSLKGKTIEEAKKLFEQFHSLVTGRLDPEKDSNVLGKLTIFSTLWHFPSRVKCASLSWHTMKGALDDQQSITTE